jgi:hypothetical protein
MDWQGWTWLTLIIGTICGLSIYGYGWDKDWAKAIAGIIGLAFIAFVFWFINAMNTDI